MAWFCHILWLQGLRFQHLFLGTQSNPQPPSTTSHFTLSTSPQHVPWGLHIQSLSALRPCPAALLFTYSAPATLVSSYSQTSLKFSFSLCFKLKPTLTTWLKTENHSSKWSLSFFVLHFRPEFSPPSHRLHSVVLFSFLNSLSQLDWNFYGGLERCPAKIVPWLTK